MIDQATWQFVNSFAAWFSAFGTISAVVLALYLARQDKRVRLNVFAGYRVMVAEGAPGSTVDYDYLMIGITNVGHREAQVTTVGWRVGLWKKKLSIQIIMRDGISSCLPVRLKDGDEAHYFIPLSGDTAWLKSFTEEFLLPNPSRRVKFIWVMVYTSVGRVFKARIEKGLREKLCVFADKQSSL